MGYAHDYADAIKHRARVPMDPADFVPDWADRPRKGKHYPGVESFPLPETDFPAGATAEQIGDIRKAAVGHALKVKVRIEVGGDGKRPPVDVITKLNARLGEVSKDLTLR